MSGFLRLPDDVWRDILGNWLHIRELGCLDISLCGQSRSNFLVLLKSIKLSWPHRKNFPPSVFDWLFSKEVKLRRLVLKGNMFSQGDLIVRFHCEFVDEVYVDFSCTIFDGINNALRACKGITFLRFIDVYAIQALEPMVLAKLQTLIVEAGRSDEVPLLRELRSNCRQLCTLHIAQPISDSNALYELIALNPNLEDVHLMCYQSILAAITQHCPKIRSVLLNTRNNPVELLSIRDMLLQRPGLSYLEVESRKNRFVFTTDFLERSVFLKSYGHTNWDPSGLQALLSVIRDVKVFEYCGMQESFPVEAALGLRVSSGSTLKWVNLDGPRPGALEALFRDSLNITELTLRSTNIDCYPFFELYGYRLKRLQAYTELSILGVVNHLVKLPNLIYGQFTVQFEDEAEENWVEWIEPVARHINELVLIRSFEDDYFTFINGKLNS